MTTQTKMIIITSDEDLIRQIALNQKSNTRIVNLDSPNEIMLSNPKDDSMMDLAFLAEFATQNSKSDQVYKRALNSSDESRSKPAKYPRKSADLVCSICGDRAVGFNYDALSCASCKAFFRRNAHQSREKLRCFSKQGQCSVAHETHRKCPRCRLDRCYAVGMRKDFILSEEEKQRRKNRLEENRNATEKQAITPPATVSSIEPLDDIDRLLKDIGETKCEDSIGMENLLFGTLPIEDWFTVESIRTSFVSIFQNLDPSQFSMDLSDQASALIAWSQNASQMGLLFIKFFRQIEEFENLCYNEDRLLLIKFNLLSIFPIFKCYIYKTANDYCSAVADEKQRQFHMLCGYSNDILDSFIDMRMRLVQLTEQDPAVLALLMPIILFTDRLSMSEDQPPFNDPLGISRAQSHYTKILWNYIANKKGENQANIYFIQLLTIIFHMQKVAHKTRDYFRSQFIASNVVDKIAPLMQTVLNIS